MPPSDNEPGGKKIEAPAWVLGFVGALVGTALLAAPPAFILSQLEQRGGWKFPGWFAEVCAVAVVGLFLILMPLLAGQAQSRIFGDAAREETPGDEGRIPQTKDEAKDLAATLRHRLERPDREQWP